jgi:hypothetical protein
VTDWIEPAFDYCQWIRPGMGPPEEPGCSMTVKLSDLGEPYRPPLSL